jgi:hypothetical protein
MKPTHSTDPILLLFIAAITEPLPSTIHIQAHRLMGEIYEVHRWDGLRCRDTHIKFHKYFFSHSNVDMAEQGHRGPQYGDHISVISCFQNE